MKWPDHFPDNCPPPAAVGANGIVYNELQGRPATRYHELLDLVLTSQTGFSIEWGSPNEEFGGSAELLVETAQNVIKLWKK